MDLVTVLETLRAYGNDTREIEVKSAAGGYPDNTAQTMSAFSNTPGGGTIIFGIDEQHGFQTIGVYDAVLCQQAAANTARNALIPQITVTSEVVSHEGKSVVLVHVPEADTELKPVKVVKSGRAYLRMYDGDYQLSEAEEQILVAKRGRPRYDEQSVDQASPDDLDPSAVTGYIHQRRSSSRRFAPMTDEEVLIRTGVLIATGEHPTLAGVLALGIYPQQFFPSLVIHASLHSIGGKERALDTQFIVGPLPAMLEDCIDWVQRVTSTAIVANDSGAVTNRPAYPPIVVRELVANALIHRDLSPASINQPITVRLTQSEQMLIVNPGGLFGVSVEGLGHAPSSLRNARLTEILQFVTDSRGDRVVERLGSGIPVAQQALHDADMAPLEFDDRGVRFTVYVKESEVHAGGWADISLSVQQLLKAFDRQPATIAQLAERTRRSTVQVRYQVAKLVDAGQLVRETLDGRTYLYYPAK